MGWSGSGVGWLIGKSRVSAVGVGWRQLRSGVKWGAVGCMMGWSGVGFSGVRYGGLGGVVLREVKWSEKNKWETDGLDTWAPLPFPFVFQMLICLTSFPEPCWLFHVHRSDQQQEWGQSLHGKQSNRSIPGQLERLYKGWQWLATNLECNWGPEAGKQAIATLNSNVDFKVSTHIGGLRAQQESCQKSFWEG